jgi:hypothetical protein
VACPVAASPSRGPGFPTKAVDFGLPAFVADHLDVAATVFALEDPRNPAVVVVVLASSTLASFVLASSALVVA